MNFLPIFVHSFKIIANITSVLYKGIFLCRRFCKIMQPYNELKHLVFLLAWSMVWNISGNTFAEVSACSRILLRSIKLSPSSVNCSSTGICGQIIWWCCSATPKDILLEHASTFNDSWNQCFYPWAIWCIIHFICRGAGGGEAVAWLFLPYLWILCNLYKYLSVQLRLMYQQFSYPKY